MSYRISVKTPNLKQMANILRAIADDIAVSPNKTITIEFELTYNVEKRRDC